MAARLLHDLVDDQLGVTSNIEVADTELVGNAQTVDEYLVFGHIVGGGEMDRTMYLMRTRRCKTRTSPVLMPFFISDPSKFNVQYSWSMIAGVI